MDNALIVSLVTVVVSAISSLGLVSWRLSQLEKKVDSHNSYAEKFAAASTDIALIKQKLEFIADKVDLRDDLVRDKLEK